MEEPAIVKELGLEKLEPIDLNKSRTVSEIARAMAKGSVMAQRLGEGVGEVERMIESGKRPILIYDGLPNDPLAEFLYRLVEKKWFKDVILPEEFAPRRNGSSQNIVVAGTYSSRHENTLLERSSARLFINDYNLPRRDELRDGYFPEEVCMDPRIFFPILAASLEERLEEKKRRISDILPAWKEMGGPATQTANACEHLWEMTQNRMLKKFITVSGIPTVAKLDLVLCEMIKRGMADYMLFTGALVGHSLTPGIGCFHYKGKPGLDDAALALYQINRITGAYELETSLNYLEMVQSGILDPWDASRPLSSRVLCDLFGKYLLKEYPKSRGILKDAYEKGVHVCIPALNDSELWNNLSLHNELRKRAGKQEIFVDFRLDVEHRIQYKVMSMLDGYELGYIVFGGGVPNNNLFNDAPLLDIRNERLGIKMPLIMFSEGIRICHERPNTGNASTATASEKKAWRKVKPDARRCTELIHDYIPLVPWIVGYVIECQDAGGN